LTLPDIVLSFPRPDPRGVQIQRPGPPS